MKRYALFAGNFYYPCGGWGDFESAFDTIDDAKAAGSAELQIRGGAYSNEQDWYHVVDLQTGEIVASQRTED